MFRKSEIKRDQASRKGIEKERVAIIEAKEACIRLTVDMVQFSESRRREGLKADRVFRSPLLLIPNHTRKPSRHSSIFHS